jgi:hypothetical protein
MYRPYKETGSLNSGTDVHVFYGKYHAFLCSAVRRKANEREFFE